MTIYVEQQNQAGTWDLWTADNKNEFMSTVSNSSDDEYFQTIHGAAAFKKYLEDIDKLESDITTGSYDSSKPIHAHQQGYSGDEQWNSYDNQADCDQAEWDHWVEVQEGDLVRCNIFYNEDEARKNCENGGGSERLRKYLDIDLDD